MRAMRGKTLETVPFQPYFEEAFGVKLVLPSNESYESKTGCNRTLATVLWVTLKTLAIVLWVPTEKLPQDSWETIFSARHWDGAHGPQGSECLTWDLPAPPHSTLGPPGPEFPRSVRYSVLENRGVWGSVQKGGGVWELGGGEKHPHPHL